ncbi:Protein DEHYDRATION-INDUCED 19 like 3 [Glycine soja]|nr:Protein DEHYDRATION-INDUCED 19 like 3 [Glycine soja]
MDGDSSWSARLSSASRRYQSALQSRSDMFMGFDENDGDDDIREEFLCPFCSEYFDIVGLCCHIDEEHPMEAKNGVCPVCALRVGVDMVAHITLQHGIFFYYIIIMGHVAVAKMHILKKDNQNKIENNTKRKRKSRKGGSYSTLSLLRKELREGNLQSLFGGSSCIVSSSNADPLLSSFILPLANEHASSQPHLHTETRSSKKCLDETVSTRNVETSTLSVKDKEEKEKRCEFVQGLLLSTILDDNL